MLTNPLMIAAVPLLSRLTDHGYEAVFVGGCVRDVSVGRQITDVDIATSAKPEEVMKLFPKTIPTGLKHGTVTVIMDDKSYELTTYRKESKYEAYRRPAEVDFITELEEDLRRRDFTMNAMAMTMDGFLIDPFGGLRDLQSGIVRCVGEPDARFQEDALRMIRGIRFASEFGHGAGSIEPETWAAILRHRDLLQYVAMERVGAELDKMMKGARPDLAMSLMDQSGLFACAKEPLRIPDSPQTAAGSITSVTDPDGRWTAWFLMRAFDGQSSRGWLRRLRFSGDRTEYISSIVAFHRQWMHSDYCRKMDSEIVQRHWTDHVIQYGRKVTAAWLDIMEQCGETEKHDINTAELKRIFERMPAVSLKELAVNGNDLMREMRMKPGNWVQRCLSKLLTETASGSIPNEKVALLAHARLQIEKEQQA